VRACVCVSVRVRAHSSSTNGGRWLKLVLFLSRSLYQSPHTHNHILMSLYRIPLRYGFPREYFPGCSLLQLNNFWTADQMYPAHPVSTVGWRWWVLSANGWINYVANKLIKINKYTKNRTKIEQSPSRLVSAINWSITRNTNIMEVITDTPKTSG